MNDDFELQPEDFDTERTIQARFEEFDRRHPEVYECMLRLAREVRQRGFRHYGMRSLWERMRWHFQFERDMGEDFKLNDHFHSRYARKLNQEPDLEGLFELRQLRAS